MPKLPRISGEDLIRVLQKEGFEIARQKGGHVQMRKFIGGEKLSFPVPVHSGKDLKTGTLHGILRKAGMSVDHLIELL